MPKPVFVNHQPRPQNNVVEQFSSYLAKPIPQPQVKPNHQLSQSFRLQTQPQPQPYLVNASMPIQVKPNVNSRIELRGNSSEKTIKENGLNKHPLTQSYM